MNSLGQPLTAARLACGEQQLKEMLEDGEESGGRTTLIPTDAMETSPTVLLIDGATKARGNLDALVFGMARFTREMDRPHSSSVLARFVDPRVEERA